MQPKLRQSPGTAKFYWFLSRGKKWLIERQQQLLQRVHQRDHANGRAYHLYAGRCGCRKLDITVPSGQTIALSTVIVLEIVSYAPTSTTTVT
ncbi:hypothetical protein [Brevibacillus agri]|uniref:hypothetical protein n=1 Tax=Brevibacillus agri TaxID=51101 RepID=UPI0004096A40